MPGLGLEVVSRSGRQAGCLARTLATLVATAAVVLALAPAATAAPGAHNLGTGFSPPFSGAPRFEYLAPTQMRTGAQLNRPLGRSAAETIARQIGLTPADALSDSQSRALMSGGGVGGSRSAAKIISECIWILSNTVGRPLTATVNGRRTTSVLASYGLYVTPNGMLQSPANASAPTRQVNTLIAPGGFVGNWLRDNGATHTLIALYRSAYTVQVPFGFAAQQMSGAAQLVTNTKGSVVTTVGMSMAPPLWIVNFALLYIVKPSYAAAMPAYWAPIPPAVAAAIKRSPTGQVPYAAYRSLLPQ